MIPICRNWEIHYGGDYIRVVPQDGHTEQAIADIYDEEAAKLIGAAPDLLWFAQQILNGIDTKMLKLETPADEVLANVLRRGRTIVFNATGYKA